MAKSWEQVKAILDNPDVPQEEKHDLLESWADAQDGDRIDDEQKKYIKDYAPDTVYDDKGVNNFDYSSVYGPIFGPVYGAIHGAIHGDVDDAYNKAKKSADDAAGREGSRQKDQQAVKDDEGRLGGIAKPGPNGAGAKNSNELLDVGNSALRMYKDFVPLLRDRPGDCVGEVPELNLRTDIQDKYDQSRDIAFDKFLAESDRFSKAKTAVDDLTDDVDGTLVSLYGGWSGAAAKTSSRWYAKNIKPNAKDLSTYLGGASDNINKVVQNIFNAVKTKVDEIQKQYSPEIGQASPEMASKVFNMARGVGADNRDKIYEIAGWVDSKTGSDVARTLNDDWCGVNDETTDLVIKQCKQWIRESFNKDLKSKLDAFSKVCGDATEQINSHYHTLSQYLAKYDGEFPKYDGPGADSGKDSDKDDGSSNSSGGSHSGSGRKDSAREDSGGAGGGSAATPGVGHGGGTNAAGVSGVDAGAGSGVTGAGALPGTGGASGSDLTGAGTLPGASTVSSGFPDAGGTDPTGDGHQGELPGAQDGDSHPDQVTVKYGHQKIEMSSPDESGTVHLTVDDGHEKPKTYAVDFGDRASAEKALASGDVGPQGISADGRDGTGVEHIKAGEDGKAVIHDGDSKIVIRRSSDGDQAIFTVDDGKGDPTTYTVGSDASDAHASGKLFGSSGGHTADIPSRAVSGDLFGDGGSGGGGGAGAGAGDGVPSGISATGDAGAGTNQQSGAQVSAVSGHSGGTNVPAAAPAAAASGGGAAGAGGGAAQGGMPMMGGMGAGGGQGGDSERSGSQWRTEGQLFDDNMPAVAVRSVRGVIGEED